jgi:hypothetical protein
VEPRVDLTLLPAVRAALHTREGESQTGKINTKISFNEMNTHGLHPKKTWKKHVGYKQMGKRISKAKSGERNENWRTATATVPQTKAKEHPRATKRK